jgi:predicted permease
MGRLIRRLRCWIRQHQADRELAEWPWLDDISQDLRHGMRVLTKSPLFTIVAVVSLALGIGGNTAIFSVMDAIYWKRLPVKDPEQLVRVTTAARAGSGPGLRFFPGLALFPQLRHGNDVFSGVIFFSEADGLSLTVDGVTERVIGEAVSGNYFAVLGVGAAHGRTFSGEIEEGSWAPEVVLSYDFWQRRFGADPSVVGKSIQLNGYPFTIVGISPRRFFGTNVGTSFEVRVPKLPEALSTAMPAMPLLRMGERVAALTARLRPGVSLQQAEAATEIAYRNAVASNPDLIGDPQVRATHIRVLPAERGTSWLRDQFERPLTILSAIVVMTLLIACANVATLLLVRATARRQELAVRLAIGAGRARLIRQLLTESLLISLLGGAAGVALAYWGVGILFGFLPQSHVRTSLEITPDLRALGFTMCASLLTAIVFGLAPAIQATNLDLLSAIKGESAGGRHRAFDLRKALVVLEVALSLALLIGAALFIRTLQNLQAVRAGFEADNVVLFTMKHVHERYTPEQIRSFCRDLLERVKGLPGVRSVGLAETGPFSGRENHRDIEASGSETTTAERPTALVDRVSPGFFASAGIPLLSGRDISVTDQEGAPKVAVVDETTARNLFGWERSRTIGGRIRVGRAPTMEEFEVVGVVGSTKHESLREPPRPAVYLSIAQGDRPWMPTLFVRTTGSATFLVAEVRREIEVLDRDLPVFNVKTLRQQLNESVAQERLVGALSGFFGVLAMLLAAIGLYGIMAYSAARRTRELGIRQALGARPGDVLWLVLGEALQLVLIGISIGLSSALAAGRLVASVLFGLTPTDPSAISLAILLLVAVAALAGYLPARRASRVDALLALRYE